MLSPELQQYKRNLLMKLKKITLIRLLPYTARHNLRRFFILSKLWISMNGTKSDSPLPQPLLRRFFRISAGSFSMFIYGVIPSSGKERWRCQVFPSGCRVSGRITTVSFPKSLVLRLPSLSFKLLFVVITELLQSRGGLLHLRFLPARKSNTENHPMPIPPDWSIHRSHGA